MDNNGNGKEISESAINSCEEYNIKNWTNSTFLSACIMSGCDYLPNLPRIGSKTAFKLINEHRSFTQVLRSLKIEGKFSIPPDYQENFEKAFLIFRFQRVYCPILKKLVYLNEMDIEKFKKDYQYNIESLENGENLASNNLLEPHLLLKLINLKDLNFLGKNMSDKIAQRIANSELNPITLTAFENDIKFKDNCFKKNSKQIFINSKYSKNNNKDKIIGLENNYPIIRKNSKNRVENKLSQKSLVSFFASKNKILDKNDQNCNDLFKENFNDNNSNNINDDDYNNNNKNVTEELKISNLGKNNTFEINKISKKEENCMDIEQESLFLNIINDNQKKQLKFKFTNEFPLKQINIQKIRNKFNEGNYNSVQNSFCKNIFKFKYD